MKILIYIIAFIFSLNVAFSDNIREDTEKLIKAAFPGNVKLKMEKYQIDKSLKKKIEVKAQQKFFKDFVYLFKVNSGNDLKGYAILDNVYGKSMPITFLVVFDKQGQILSTDVVKYREQYGGQVKNKNWNEQFEGKSSESSFKVGEDISTISGATISVHSVAKGVEKLSHLMKYIIRGK